MTKHERYLWLESIQDNLTQVPTENLERLNEAALLLSDLLPPWDNKCASVQAVEEALDDSIAHDRWVNEYYYPNPHE